MSALGIVCEYNPFHNGHACQIAAARELLGTDAPVICVMSGNFVQRGECAVMPKHARAMMAICGGANLVLELPTVYAVSSAEKFALAAVTILNASGVVDTLVFGSEAGTIEPLSNIADALIDNDTILKVKSKLKAGVSYAAARENALREIIGDNANLLREPNNILAVEYLKALKRLNSEITPLTIKRSGSGHDGESSALAIRGMLRRGEEVSRYIPAQCMAVLRDEIAAGRAPLTMEPLENAILYRLRTMTEDEYAALPDVTEGLWLRLMRAGKNENTVAGVIEYTKTKRYAYSRIRRMVLAALLGITGSDTDTLPLYIRVLAFDNTGRQLLREMRGKALLPVIVKPASARKMPFPVISAFEKEARFTDIFSILYGGRGEEWETSPLFING